MHPSCGASRSTTAWLNGDVFKMFHPSPGIAVAPGCTFVRMTKSPINIWSSVLSQKEFNHCTFAELQIIYNHFVPMRGANTSAHAPDLSVFNIPDDRCRYQCYIPCFTTYSVNGEPLDDRSSIPGTSRDFFLFTTPASSTLGTTQSFIKLISVVELLPFSHTSSWRGAWLSTGTTLPYH